MQIDLNILSRNRQELMGISILLIMLFHSFLGQSSNFILKVISLGDMGVEWFIFLSGIGLYYSLDKDSHLDHFYRKRFSRIMPSYLLVVATFFAWQDMVKKFDPLSFISNVLRIPFFTTGNRWFWFVILIVLCYLVAPAFFRWIRNGSFKLVHTCLLLALITGLSLLCENVSNIANLRMLFFRIPTFILGMQIGRIMKNGEQVRIEIPFIVIFVLSTFFLVLSRYLQFRPELIYVAYFIVTPALLFLAGKLMDYSSSHFTWNNLAMAFLGGISWECYILHEAFILRYTNGFISNVSLQAIVSIILTIPIAWGLNRLSLWIVNIFSKKCRKSLS